MLCPMTRKGQGKQRGRELFFQARILISANSKDKNCHEIASINMIWISAAYLLILPDFQGFQQEIQAAWMVALLYMLRWVKAVENWRLL